MIDVICETAASTSRNLLEIHIHRPHPTPIELVDFNLLRKFPKLLRCIFKLEKI
jgi:hypothetical protein